MARLHRNQARVLIAALVALSAVGESNFLLTGPERLLRKFEQAFDLYLTAPPFVMPPFEISLVWNRLNETDRGLGWLREQLVDIAVKELRGQVGSK